MILLLLAMMRMLIFAGQAHKQEFEKNPGPAQLQCVKYVLDDFSVVLQYVQNICILKNCCTMPITNSKMGASMVIYVPWGS